MTEIIMSIKPQFVDKIISGEKTVELRSRRLNIRSGSRIWIYSTLPKACIEVVATVRTIEFTSPEIIWAMYSEELAITREEFKKYTNGNKSVSAIQLENVLKVNTPLTLEGIRSTVQKFQPPQFFSYIKTNIGLSELLKSVGFCQCATPSGSWCQNSGGTILKCRDQVSAHS